MNRIQQQIIDMLREYCPDASQETLSNLIRSGIVDTRTCIAMIVRRQVEEDVRKGKPKLDAIEHAAEDFACTVAFVKRAVYRYK